jgi:hypothetical protein
MTGIRIDRFTRPGPDAIIRANLSLRGLAGTAVAVPSAPVLEPENP